MGLTKFCDVASTAGMPSSEPLAFDPNLPPKSKVIAKKQKKKKKKKLSQITPNAGCSSPFE
jgi:hypothetical protein